MEWEKSNVQDAFDLFLSLTYDGKITKKTNPQLFSSYQQMDVREIVEELIEERADVKIFEIEDVIYMIPQMDNQLHSYTNEELREKMKLKNNKELYLTYFCMLVLLSKFYNSKEQSWVTRSYVTIEELLQSINDKMNESERTLRSKEQPEELGEELGLDIEGMLEVWNGLTEYNEKAKKIELTDKNKVGFLLKIFRFMEKEDLVIVRESKEVSITEKMQRIVSYYYFNGERKEKMMDLLTKSLRREDLQDA